jgi:hypothetical protein
MKRVGELRQQAERYRQLQSQISDPRAVQAICELAGEFEMTATELEKRHLIRERAHEIWIESGCAEGRDIEHWLMAERELAGKSLSNLSEAALPRRADTRAIEPNLTKSHCGARFHQNGA